ncbi:hypothetical protein GY45DRAFT_322628 [Cubamyces sp. BRFM 1775]|nr:hypothetical protein GY45DRAFT_322628 [Cubamyces sp. BRFM 1775]
MHRCLLNTDVFRRILDFVEVELPDSFYAGYHLRPSKNATLNHLARTCRVFLEPSLNALWKNQLTLGPLVQTLPSDAYEEVVVRTPAITEYHPVLRRPLLASDWSRFDYYAARIRALGYFLVEFEDTEAVSWSAPSERPREREVDVDVVWQICTQRRTQWLLPNLIRLRWNIYDVPYTSYLPCLLGPRLTTLAIAFKPEAFRSVGMVYDPSPLQLVLDALPSLCPSLTSIEMYTEHGLLTVLAAWRFAYFCRRLGGLAVRGGSVDRSLVSFLATRMRLRKVLLDLDEELTEDLTFLSTNPRRHPFESLQILWVKVPHLTACTTLIKLMHSCRLSSITCEFNNRCNAKAVREFSTALRDCCAKYTLHVCRLVQPGLVYDEDDGDIEETFANPQYPADYVGFNELAPLLEFPNLRVFEYDLCTLGGSEDDELVRMADAWRGLIYFLFLYGWGAQMEATCTWRGIGYLVSRCTQMIEFRMAFDATVDNVALVVNEPDFRPNKHLRIFDVLDSWLPDDLHGFARALFSVAPRVTSVEAMQRDITPYDPIPQDMYSFCDMVENDLRRLRTKYCGDSYKKDPNYDIEMDDDPPWEEWATRPPWGTE